MSEKINAQTGNTWNSSVPTASLQILPAELWIPLRIRYWFAVRRRWAVGREPPGRVPS